MIVVRPKVAEFQSNHNFNASDAYDSYVHTQRLSIPDIAGGVTTALTTGWNQTCSVNIQLPLPEGSKREEMRIEYDTKYRTNGIIRGHVLEHSQAFPCICPISSKHWKLCNEL